MRVAKCVAQGVERSIKELGSSRRFQADAFGKLGLGDFLFSQGLEDQFPCSVRDVHESPFEKKLNYFQSFFLLSEKGVLPSSA